ncbi:MAG: hypothetical protein KC646_09535 [Candidatus Cloacimonetes bacterium]|nr:hypothetical protein [Candidatus Cloacimonadota bacterium]
MRKSLTFQRIGLLLSMSSMLLTTGFAANFDGIATRSGDSKVVETEKYDGTTSLKDFEYIDMGLSDSLIKKRFPEFSSAHRNTGLMLSFLKKFDRTSLTLLKEYLEGSSGTLWNRLQAVGADKEELDKAVKDLMEKQGILDEYNASLKQIKDIEDGMKETEKNSKAYEEQIEKLRSIIKKDFAALMAKFRLSLDNIIDAMGINWFNKRSDDWENLSNQVTRDLSDIMEVLKEDDEETFKKLRKVAFVHGDGESHKVNIFEELIQRIVYIKEFAKGAKKDPHRYVVAYLLSWQMTKRNVNVALLGDLSEPKTKPKTKPVKVTKKPKKKDKKPKVKKGSSTDTAAKKKERELLQRHYKEIAALFNEKRYVGVDKKVKLHFALTKINALYASSDIDGVNKALVQVQEKLKKQIESNPSLAESPESKNIARAMLQLDSEIKQAALKQAAREAKVKAINDTLAKVGIKRDVSTLKSTADIKAFMLEITKTKLTKESKAVLANQLTDLVHLSVATMTYLERAANQYTLTKKMVGEFKETVTLDKTAIIKWIARYDRNHASNDKIKSYKQLIQTLLQRVQKDFPGRVEVLNTPFASAQANCRQFYPAASLQFTKSTSSSTVDEKIEICYADFEITTRKKWEERKNDFMLEQIVKDSEALHFNVKNSEAQDMLESIDLSDAQDASASMFDGLLKILNNTKEISNVEIDKTMKLTAKAMLTSSRQGVGKIENGSSTEFEAEVGDKIYRSFSRMKEKIKIRTPKKGSKAYSGLWLGLTIGASDLRNETRDIRKLTGPPAIEALETHLSRYLGSKAREFLERRVLLTGYHGLKLRSQKLLTVLLPEQKAIITSYENSGLLKLSDVVPNTNFSTDKDITVGFGYGNYIVPGTTRAVRAQARLYGFKNWLLERSEFKYYFNHKSGNIYQVFIPVYKLEQKPGAEKDVYWNKTANVWNRENVVKLFSKAVESSKVNLEMQTTKVDSIDFGDVLYLDGEPILDGTGQEIKTGTVPGIKINYAN